MKRATGAEALCRPQRDVVSIAEQSRFENAGSFGREVRRELLFQMLAPFVNPCQRKEDTLVVQSLDKQRTLHYARGVVAFALKVLS